MQETKEILLTVVGAIRSISPSLVEFLQVIAIKGIQVYQFEFLANWTIQAQFSCQLTNLDTRLYQSVSLDPNYHS